MSSREKAKAKRSSVDGSDEQKCFWLLSGCCKATADQIHITMPFMPLLKLAICFQCDAPKNFIRTMHSAHLDNRWTSINVNSCEYHARPSQACGGCGGAWRGTRRARTTGLWPPPYSPRKKIRRPMTVQAQVVK